MGQDHRPLAFPKLRHADGTLVHPHPDAAELLLDLSFARDASRIALDQPNRERRQLFRRGGGWFGRSEEFADG